jgi:hypothetical protein
MCSFVLKHLNDVFKQQKEETSSGCLCVSLHPNSWNNRLIFLTFNMNFVTLEEKRTCAAGSRLVKMFVAVQVEMCLYIIEVIVCIVCNNKLVAL